MPGRVPWLTGAVAALCLLATAADHLAARWPDTAWLVADQVCRVRLSELWGGRYWGLVTSAFVHGAPSSLGVTALHLGFNLLFLLRLGRMLEATLGRAAWLAFFVTAAVASSGAEIALSSAMAVGVSGVLYAMFGLMWAGRHHQPAWRTIATRSLLLELAGWGLFCVVATAVFRWPIANAAHAGGFAYGVSIGWLLEGRRRAQSALLLGLLGALVAASLSWMPWSGVWCEWRAGQAAAHAMPSQAVSWYERSLRLGQDPTRVWLEILAVQRARGNTAGADRAIDQLVGLGALRPQDAPTDGGYWPEWMDGSVGSAGPPGPRTGPEPPRAPAPEGVPPAGTP